MKEARGCEGFPNGPRVIDEIGVEISRCPKKEITARSIAYINAYNYEVKGFLPNAGGWLDQPTKYTLAMQVIETALMKLEEKKNGERRP